METISVAFSQLIKEPTKVLNKLTNAPNGKVRLVRRDGESVTLVSDDKAAADTHTNEAMSQVFTALMTTDDGVRDLILAMPAVYPWLSFFDPDEVREFTVEFVETARTCASLDNYIPLDAVVAAWRHTAEIYADPELYAILTQPLGDPDPDLGPVPIPEVDDDDDA